MHEWTAPAVVSKIGQYCRCSSSTRAFFHDTHHRAVTAPHELSRNDLSGYDGLLVYGNALRGITCGAVGGTGSMCGMRPRIFACSILSTA